MYVWLHDNNHSNTSSTNNKVDVYIYRERERNVLCVIVHCDIWYHIMLSKCYPISYYGKTTKTSLRSLASAGQCLAVLGSAWQCLAVLGCACLYLAVFGRAWLFLAVLGCAALRCAVLCAVCCVLCAPRRAAQRSAAPRRAALGCVTVLAVLA